MIEAPSIRWKSTDQRSWLTYGFSFLSGYANPQRKVVMPLQVMLDDSGGENQGVFCFAGLIAEADDWIAFSEKWDLALKESPRIGYLKMRDATSARPAGEFSGMTPMQRDIKLLRLATLITDLKPTLLTIVLQAEPFVRLYRNAVPKPWSKPYAFAFNAAISYSCEEVISRGIRTRFEMIFDEQKSVGRQVRKWYPISRSLANPRWQPVMPIDPMFKDDEDFLPLQACDMYAWLCRRDFAGEPHDFAWLRDVLLSVPRSKFCQEFDEPRFAAILRRAQELHAQKHPGAKAFQARPNDKKDGKRR